jgi:L-amino acid N-acyltransferase YncA
MATLNTAGGSLTEARSVQVRTVRAGDAESIARIYNHYVAQTTITFEEAAVAVADMRQRLDDIAAANLPFLVADAGGDVIGYASAGKWKGRCAYRFSVEVSVYIDPAHGRKGVGSALYAELFPLLRDSGIHAVIGGIALPNQASVALHEKFGLTKVAHFREVGFKFERWIDVGYWQRVFE